MQAHWHHGGEIYDKAVTLDYSVNVNPLGLPPAVKKALTEDLTYAERYPDIECRALKAALAKRYDLPDMKVDCIMNLRREELLFQMAAYESVYAVGRTAIEAKILGCNVLPTKRFPDPERWEIMDNLQAAEILAKELASL